VLLAGALGLAGVALMTMCSRPRDEDVVVEVDQPVVVSPADIVVASVSEIEAGPLLSGSLEPERSATVRAEVAGPVLTMAVEVGDAVQAGEVVARIEDAALRDALLSTHSAASTAEQSAVLARRNAERSERLFAEGAIAERELEDARLAAEAAESQLADARARVSLAQDQLGKATVRAPFAGVVSERPASAGDVVQTGGELFTVVDPASMRLEAGVPSADLEAVAVGAEVEFVVTGYEPITFTGRIARISPVVDPVTRQIPVVVSIPNHGGRLVGGLYAEGRVANRSRTSLTLPLDAVDEERTPATALRVHGARVVEVTVTLGLRDEEAERVEIVSGLAPGDTVLRGPARGIAPGTVVEVDELVSAAVGGARSAP
jgi:RND family efflux transporter MFP subunit